MQQYFSDTPLVVGQEYIFNKDQAHHAKNVVRLHHEKIRLVYDGIGYFADAYNRGKDFVAMVLEEDERINEVLLHNSSHNRKENELLVFFLCFCFLNCYFNL